MSDEGTFTRISESGEEKLYGPRKFLLCGFSSEAQGKMEKLLEMIGMAAVGRIWASQADGEKRVGELMAMGAGTGRGTDSGLPRAVIMAGITEKELSFFVDSCRQAGMRQAFFAALTPVSETWALADLLAELAREREALAGPTPS